MILDDIELVCKAFYDKFQVYPFITVEDLESYGRNFLLWKDKGLGADTNAYYKIGKTSSWALWFVDGWKKIPHGAVTFSSVSDMRLYSIGFELSSINVDKNIGRNFSNENGDVE